MSTQPLFTTQIDQLPVSIYATNEALGAAAAAEAAEAIRAAVPQRGVANIILATGNSQLTFLAALRTLAGMPWECVNVFHMDEYVNLPPGHPASFPAFLRRHLLDYVKVARILPRPGAAADPAAACREYEALLRAHPADLCALGIGENGHLAFNDPPFAFSRIPCGSRSSNWTNALGGTGRRRPLRQPGRGADPRHRPDDPGALRHAACWRSCPRRARQRRSRRLCSARPQRRAPALSYDRRPTRISSSWIKI